MSSASSRDSQPALVLEAPLRHSVLNTWTSLSLCSTKYDGSLHYHHPLWLLHRDENLLVACCEPGHPMRSYRSTAPCFLHSLHFYWKTHPFNVNVLWRNDRSPLSVYVNIATPATWDDRTVRFVDLDLDVPWKFSQPQPHVEDHEEFDLHRRTMNYPDELVSQCQGAVQTVLDFFSRKRKPFCRSLFAWNPTLPVPPECLLPLSDEPRP